jgi:hypothetical protein
MNRHTACSLANRLLDGSIRKDRDDVVIVEDATIESDDYWVFCYNTRAYVETGDFRQALVGNAPIFVSRIDGSAHLGRTDRSVEAQLHELRHDHPPAVGDADGSH